MSNTNGNVADNDAFVMEENPYRRKDTLTDNKELGSLAVWDRGDIPEDNVALYKERLYQADKEAILVELHTSCTNDHQRRFQLAHDQLQHFCQLNYSDEKFDYKDTEMDNLLLYAMAVDSWEICKFLITSNNSDLILRQCQNDNKKGTTVLHLAIIKNRKDIIRLIMDSLETDDQRKQLINIQGTGAIFRGHFNNCSNPITLAIYCGFEDVLLDLVKYGGDLESKDQLTGNGVVHTLVEYGVGDPEKAVNIIDKIFNSPVTIDWYCKKYGVPLQGYTTYEQVKMKTILLKAENYEGYNALAYSAKLGVHNLLTYIVNCEGVYKNTKWKLGSRSLATYDISEIDPTVVWLERPKSPCVLELLLYERNDDNIPSLSMEPLRTLLEVKWKQFKIPYTVAALFHFVVICLQTYFAVVLSTTANVSNISLSDVDDEKTDSDDYLINIGFICVTVIVVLYLLMEVMEIIIASRLFVMGRLCWRPDCGHYRTPWSIILKLDQYDIIMSIYCISSIIYMPGTMYTALAIALASGWYFMLFYTQAYRPTSFFNVMLGRMFWSDLPRFSIALAVFVIGFGVALMVLVSHDPLPEAFSSFKACVKTMILLLVGLGNVNFLEHPRPNYPNLASFMTILYIIVGMILLLNMLIAAMSDTYASMSGSREGLWLKMRLFSIMVIERRIPGFMLRAMRGSNSYIKRDTQDPAKWSLAVETISKKSEISTMMAMGHRLYSNLLH